MNGRLLNSLALIGCHRNINIDANAVIDSFRDVKPRRIEVCIFVCVNTINDWCVTIILNSRFHTQNIQNMNCLLMMCGSLFEL